MRNDPDFSTSTPQHIRPRGRLRFFLPPLVRSGHGGTPSWKRNLYGIWVAQLLVIMGFSMRAPFLPQFLNELGVTTSEGQAFWSGLFMSFGAGVMAITSPIWGAVADRYGRKPMLVRAQFAAFITIGLSSFVTAPGQLLGLRLVEGAMTGTVAAATALIAVSMPRERLGYGLGMVQTAVFSGSALGPLLGGFIADAIGYRATFQVSGLMACAAGLITVFVVQEQFVRPEKIAEDSGDAEARDSIWKLLLGPTLFALTMSMLLVRFASSAVQPITPIFVAEISGSASNVNTLSGITLGILGVTSAISSVYLGKLGDRRGHFAILLFCTIGAGLVYLPMAASQHPWHLIGLQAVFGLFAGGLIPAANALIARVTAESKRGVVFGFMNTAGSIGGFAGPLAGAALAGFFGIRATFVLTGIVLLLLALTLWIANIRRPMDSARPDTA